MMDALSIITSIAVLLLVGVLSSVIARRIKLPDVLALLIIGVAFSFIKYKGETMIQFPPLFLAGISLIALALITFDSSAELRLRDIDTMSLKAIKLVLITTLMNLVIFSVICKFMLGLSVWLSILLAAINLGTSSDIILPMMQGIKNRAFTILRLESIFNSPVTVLFPFIIVDLIKGAPKALFQEFIAMIAPFLIKIVAGLGAGILIAVILFKLVQRRYSPVYSPLAVIISALLAYVLAENLGGNGVLAVTTLGVFFGNIYVKEKISLLSVESVLTKALFIFVFVLVGLTIKIPLTFEFFIRSILLFSAYLLIRFIAVRISNYHEKFTLKELLFLTLCAPKGISTAAVVFIFAINNAPGTAYFIPGVSIVLDMTLAFIFYSIILSSVVFWKKEHFGIGA